MKATKNIAMTLIRGWGVCNGVRRATELALQSWVASGVYGKELLQVHCAAASMHVGVSGNGLLAHHVAAPTAHV